MPEPVAQPVGGSDCGSKGMGFDPHSVQSKVRLFSLSNSKIVLMVQSCRVPTPPSTGSLVSVSCDQPPLIYSGVCELKAITKPY
jgi:hypothetical protein